MRENSTEIFRLPYQTPTDSKYNLSKSIWYRKTFTYEDPLFSLAKENSLLPKNDECVLEMACKRIN
jgi:hypothetical protein